MIGVLPNRQTQAFGCAIVEGLRSSLRDPWSIRDFAICPAKNIELVDGSPARWTVMIGLNSRNAYGGYTGRTIYSVVFEDGEVAGEIRPTGLCALWYFGRPGARRPDRDARQLSSHIGRTHCRAARPARSMIPAETDGRSMDAVIEDLSAAPLDELRERWRAAHPGTVLPKGLSRDLLVRGIAWNLQCARFGGLEPRIERSLKMARQLAVSGTLEIERSVRPKPGTRLIRERRGRTYFVEVSDAEFIHDGLTYASLSHVARAITETRWSGPRFFGLRPQDVASGEAGSCQRIGPVMTQTAAVDRREQRSIPASRPMRASAWSATRSMPSARPAPPMSSASVMRAGMRSRTAMMMAAIQAAA